MMPEQTKRLIMRALTVQQPWAYAISHLGKDVENRTWKPPEHVVTTYIAIHAGKATDGSGYGAIRTILERPDLDLSPGVMSLGKVVAVAKLAGWTRDSRSPWAFGPIVWILEDVRPLPNPTHAVGKQGLWTLSANEQLQMARCNAAVLPTAP